MDYRSMFASKYLQSADLTGRDYTLTIKAVEKGEIDEKTMPIVTLAETKKKWGVNRTNAEALKLLWGEDTDNWLGKSVTLYSETIDDPFAKVKGAKTTAIRVRGSPELKEARSATVKRGKKTIHVHVVPTKAKGKPAPQPQPEPNPVTGEVPFDDVPPEPPEDYVGETGGH